MLEKNVPDYKDFELAPALAGVVYRSSTNNAMAHG